MSFNPNCGNYPLFINYIISAKALTTNHDTQDLYSSIQHLASGDRLYQLLIFNKEGKLPEVIDVFAQTDGLVFSVSTNHAVNQGEYLLEMM